MELRIVLPRKDDGAIEWVLEGITRALAAKDADSIAHGCLGGEFGYGGDIENEVFMMHHYCWCESEDCPWCAGCRCPETAFTHYWDGKVVSSKEQLANNTKFLGPMPHELHKHGTPEFMKYDKEWNARVKIRNRLMKTEHKPECDYCKCEGIFKRFGESKHLGAPNFWHKKSGLKVWWYKYIGRDMTIEGEADLQTVFDESLASLKKLATAS